MERRQTDRARLACSHWLAYCLKIGWRRDQLDALEATWWEHHDDNGVLT